MRIGLILFGHLRSFRSTHDSFEEFKKALRQIGDVDVFCHTWDIEESVTASWWKEHKADDIPRGTVNSKEIETRYKPIAYIIEPSRKFDDSGYNIKSSIPVAGILSMLYSQLQAFQLLELYSKESGTVYDVVIKSRYDLLYEIDPSFSTLVNECVENNCLYLPTSNPFELAGSFSDIFVLGPEELVIEYFDFAANFKTVAEKYQQKGYAELLPELCLTQYLIEKEVSIHELVGLRIHILRLSGDRFQINTDKNFANNKPLCFFRDTIETNRNIFPDKNSIVVENTARLVKKYMRWVDVEADAQTLQHYADLYAGKWIGTSKIKRLAAKAKGNAVFSPNVMKNFFEETMRNAKYGQIKKILLASTLAAWSGYGSFFFRVLKRMSFNRS